MRIVALAALIFAIAGAVLFLWGDPAAQPPLSCEGCNVIIIGFDALQAGHVRHLGYGRETTPNLDTLAAQGVTFERNYSVAPWTVPSFMSYLTSLYPAEHGLRNKYEIFTAEVQKIGRVRDSARTLAEEFKEAGYITGGFTGDAGVLSDFGYDRGFDVYTDEQPFGSVKRSSEHALDWLDQNKGKKFFMFLHGYDAHGQFTELPKGYVSPFSEGDSSAISTSRQRELREKGLESGELDVSDAEKKEWVAWYDGKILEADKKIGAFFAELEKRGLRENTLIVVISDHGTEVFEHGRVDHGFSLYDELIHVPLVISRPGQHLGIRVPAAVRTIDLAPTLFDIVGINPSSVWQKQARGSTLLPLIKGSETENRPAFAETDYREYTFKRSYLSPDGWKYIKTLETGEEELYDLNRDPGEKENLALRETKRLATMRQVLAEHLENVGESIDMKPKVGCLPVYGDQCK